MKLQITVTQDNIDKAIPSSKCSCPVALAVTDEALRQGCTKHETHASIDLTEGRLHACFDREDPTDPKFVSDREDKLSVAPFEFAVNATRYEHVECSHSGVK